MLRMLDTRCGIKHPGYVEKMSRPSRPSYYKAMFDSYGIRRNYIVGIVLSVIVTLWFASHGQLLSQKSATTNAAQAGEWPFYGGDSGGSRFSPLTQIGPSNVGRLKVAWIYHTGHVSDGTKYARSAHLRPRPIMVDGPL